MLRIGLFAVVLTVAATCLGADEPTAKPTKEQIVKFVDQCRQFNELAYWHVRLQLSDTVVTERSPSQIRGEIRITELKLISMLDHRDFRKSVVVWADDATFIVQAKSKDHWRFKYIQGVYKGKALRQTLASKGINGKTRVLDRRWFDREFD